MYNNKFFNVLVISNTSDDGGHLKVVEDRPYFSNSSIVDFSNSGISVIEPSAWIRLLSPNGSLKQLLLNGNNVTTLPRDAVTAAGNISDQLTIRLDGNPWRCQCDDFWFVRWIQNNQVKLFSILR